MFPFCDSFDGLYFGMLLGMFSVSLGSVMWSGYYGNWCVHYDVLVVLVVFKVADVFK